MANELGAAGELSPRKTVARTAIQLLKLCGNNKKAMARFDHCPYSSNEADRLRPKRADQ